MGSQMKAHVIVNGRVANTIEVASLDVMPGLIDATNGGEVGNLWDGHSFTQSPEQIAPDEAHEAKIALEAGKTQVISDNLSS
jgi:hypothetical protein